LSTDKIAIDVLVPDKCSLLFRFHLTGTIHTKVGTARSIKLGI
jgi:hypothetical protein